MVRGFGVCGAAMGVLAVALGIIAILKKSDAISPGVIATSYFVEGYCNKPFFFDIFGRVLQNVLFESS